MTKTQKHEALAVLSLIAAAIVLAIGAFFAAYYLLHFDAPALSFLPLVAAAPVCFEYARRAEKHFDEAARAAR